MTTDELIRVINNSDIRSISTFINKLQKICPDIKNISIIDKVDLGLSGIMSAVRFYNGTDEIIVKGFLYESPNWTNDTHGYIVAKKI